MAAEINGTYLALEDIAHIAAFISKDSHHYAHIQTERFFASVKVLENFSLYDKVVPEFSDSDLRDILEGNYRIIYRVVSVTQIDIHTIYHSSRLISSNPLFG